MCSLLDILAARKGKRGITGTVLINGQRQPDNFKCMSGYVVQVSPLVHPTLSLSINAFIHYNHQCTTFIAIDYKIVFYVC